MPGLLKKLNISIEDVFDGTAALKREKTYDFDAALTATIKKIASAAPQGIVEWAAARRPDLMAATNKAGELVDATAADEDATAFELALGEYEEAWKRIIAARRQEIAGLSPGEDISRAPGGAVNISSPHDTPGGQGTGLGRQDGPQAVDAHPAGRPGSRSGGKPLPPNEEKSNGVYPDNSDHRNTPSNVNSPTRGRFCGLEGYSGEGKDGKSAPPPTEQLLLFPEAPGKAGRAEPPSAPRLPFDPEPAPTAWQDWLDRVIVTVVKDVDGWRSALAAAKAAGVCGFDTETTGLDPFTAEIRLLQLAVPVYPAGKKNLVAEDGKGPEPGSGAAAYVADLARFDESGRRELLAGVAGLMADPGVSFAGCNLKFDLKFLRAALAAAEGEPRWPGKRLACERLFDVMLASQLVTAGDFIPEAQFSKWREANGVHLVKAGGGPTRYYDRHGHGLKFEHETQKRIRPVYPTHSLKEIAHRHLEVSLDKEEQTSDWSDPELTERQLRYAGLDAAVVLPLREILANLLYRNKMARAAKIEFDCLPATVEIEFCGMPFDADRAWEMEKGVKAEAEYARAELVALARDAGFRARPKRTGKRHSPDMNPDSSVDVVDCLALLAEQERILADEESGKVFHLPNGETLPLESRDDTLTRVAGALPDGNELKRFISLLKKYRGQKKKADFLRSWLESLHPVTGRLHANLRQLNPQGVGRFSASKPNIQQAGRDKEIRALFRSQEGRKLVLADYSAIEMRVAAELTHDKNLLKAFSEGIDIHKFTAASISGKDLKSITKAERQMGKPLNFGLIYGMQAATLKDYSEIGYGVKMPLEEAEAAREKFFQTYPGISRWHASQERRGYESGFEIFIRHDALHGYFVEKRPCVRTLSSRMRVWPVVTQTSRTGRTYVRKAGSFTELYNSPDQGTGADIIKLAMGLIYRELCERGWDDVFLILCVHDELHLEAPEARADEALELLRSAMIKAGVEVLPSVPVEVEAVAGDSWSDKA